MIVPAREFTAIVQSRPQGGIAIRVPFEPSEAWGQRDRYDLTGSIAGRKVRGKLVPRSDGFYLEMGPAWCRDAPVLAGEEVTVVLAPEGPQLGAVGADVTAALEAEPEARRLFEALPTFYRKNFMRWIDSAKRPETRAKRIAEMVETLKAGKRER